jgi:hypothetical protein
MTYDLRPHSARPATAGAIALVLIVAAACSPATTPSASPTGAPGATTGATVPPSPTASPVADGIAHPTGAGDVVLRMESGGGFAPIDSIATAAPSFTLYGDGTVVFRDPTASLPAGAGNVNRLAPFQTIRLDEEGIQALLEDAIGRGGLGIAAGPYIGQGADLPTTTFTITADGRTKEVSVMALSPEMHPQDQAIVAALAVRPSGSMASRASSPASRSTFRRPTGASSCRSTSRSGQSWTGHGRRSSPPSSSPGTTSS